MKFEYWKNESEWFFNIVGGNGETMASSEGYKNKRDCLHTIDVIKSGAFTVQKFTSKENYYFRFRAGNGEIIARSEGYTRKPARELSIGTIKTGVADAPIVYVNK